MAFAAAVLLLASGAVTAQESRQPVWFWFATCDGPMMTIEVRLDGRELHRSSIPVCRARRDDAASQGQQGRVAFTFIPRRNITWNNGRTPSEAHVEIDIWQAGADPDGLLLGVSAVTPEKVLVNTIHIARPDRRDESTIVRGLAIATYPTRSGPSR